MSHFVMPHWRNSRRETHKGAKLRNTFKRGLLVLAIASSLLPNRVALAEPSNPTNAPKAAILYPPDGCLLQSNQVQVVLASESTPAPPVVTLDGQPLKLEQLAFAEAWLFKEFKPVAGSSSRPSGRRALSQPILRDKANKTIWTATAILTSGQHAIAMGDLRCQLFRVSSPDEQAAPKGWPTFNPHPALNQGEPIPCSSCHDVKTSGASAVLGRAKTPKSCHTCHNEVDLRLAHSHVMDPLANCLMCHDPHGTVRAKLLIDLKEKLCTQCHEAGHSAN